MSGKEVVVPPDTWVRLPGSEWEVWHRQNRTVLLTDHPKGVHGLAIRRVAQKKQT